MKLRKNLKSILLLSSGIIIGSTVSSMANSYIQALQNTEISISIDNQIRVLTDETTGIREYPLTYNNRTYIPLRSIANLLGCTVDYNTNTKTAIIKTNNESANNSENIVYTFYKDEVMGEIPKININSEDVLEINKKMDSIKNDMLDAKNGGYNFYNIDYKYYINDRILSIVIHHISHDGDALNSYDVFNINLDSGEIINNKELLKLKNISEEDALAKLPEIYINEYINFSCKNFITTEEQANKLKNGEKIITGSESDEYIYQGYLDTLGVVPKNIDEALIYLDENGEITAAAHCIQGIAGASW